MSKLEEGDNIGTNIQILQTKCIEKMNKLITKRML